MIDHIEFEQKDKQSVRVIGVMKNGDRKLIGGIFTPAGSGNDALNAIQVCGFREAFDLWGCGRFIVPRLKSNDCEYVRDGNGKNVMEHAKDIQLLYDSDTEPAYLTSPHENCWGCFNTPCTCERTQKYENPYTVKRAQDLKLWTKADDSKLKEREAHD